MKPRDYMDRKKVVPRPDNASRYAMFTIKSHRRPLPFTPKSVQKPDSPDRRGKTQ